MPVYAPNGSFASGGLIHIIAWLAVPLVVMLLLAATPAFRRHVSRHRDQARSHLYGPTAIDAPPSSADTATDADGVAESDDDFDYDIYDH